MVKKTTGEEHEPVELTKSVQAQVDAGRRGGSLGSARKRKDRMEEIIAQTRRGKPRK